MRSPLYLLLKKADHFEWTLEAQEAIDKVKQLLTKASIRVPPTDGEPLLLYIAAITRMGLIRNIKGVQRVIGCLATLSRFISCLSKRGLPLYRLLKKVDRFESTPEA